MSWALITLLAINLWALSNVVDKHIVHRHVKNPFIPVSIDVVVIGLLVPLIAFFAKVSVPGAANIFLAILTGIVWFTGVVLYFKALQREEVSRVVPFFAIIPMFVLLIATFFLGESFGAGRYVGIFLLVAGGFLISYRHKTGKFSKSVLLIIISSLFFATGDVLIKYLTTKVDFLSAFVFTEIGFMIASIASCIYHRKEIIRLFKTSRKSVYVILFSGLIGFFGYLAFFWALSQGPVSLVSSLGNTQGFFVLLYATLLSIFRPRAIEEELRGSVIALKLAAIAVMFAGAYLVSV